MNPHRLVGLYPAAWRQRYGEEFLATLGSGPLRAQQVIDIVSGAIDARLSADVRRATSASPAAGHGGGTMLRFLACGRERSRVTTRDGLLGAAVMVVGSIGLALLGIAARRNGFPATGEMLKSCSFSLSLSLSMPLWAMKGQPWKAQLVIVGATCIFLVLIGYLA